MNSTYPRPTRCLITGAGGYLGTRLRQRLADQGRQGFVGMVRDAALAARLSATGNETVVADLLASPQVARALKGCDAVVHLAQGDKGPVATKRLVDEAIRQGVRRFVHISTMSVHGPAPGPEAAREETARIGRYDHEYSDSKAEQEQIVQAAHDRGDLPVVILRPTVIYGLGGHFEKQVIEQALGGVVTLFDDGAGLCNAVFVDDVCDAIDAALQRPQALGAAMFINADRAITWGEFIRTFAAMVEPAPRLANLDSREAFAYWHAHPPAVVKGLTDRVLLKLRRLSGWQPPVAPWPPAGRVLRETFPIAFSNDKAKRLLGWAPQIDFAQGAALSRAWLLANGRLSALRQ